MSKTLNRNFDAIVADLGGEDVLSQVKRSMIERFVFLAACLQTWENQIATQGTKGTEKLLGRWIQATNALTGIAKTLGLKIVKPKHVTLTGYLKKRMPRTIEHNPSDP